MRRKRKRSIKWRSIFLVLLIGNVAAGLLISPATAVRSVRVTGVRQEDEPFVRHVLQGLKDRPYFRIESRQIESRLLAAGHIRRVSLDRNLLGRGLLKVAYRDPVATLAGSGTLKLCGEGEIYGDGHTYVGLPEVELPPTASGANLSLAFPIELRPLATIAARLQRMGLADKATIVVEESGSISVRRPEGGRIVLGAAKDLDEKFEKVQAYLDENPGALSKIAELNATVPERLTITPRR
jgi:hypothetical protein